MIGAGAIMGAASGLMQIGQGIFGSKKRKREEKAAQAERAKYMDRFEQMDTSNPYSNMENVYEDLTVNTGQAEFAAQQQQQGLQNIMTNLQGAAGGSGIAGLAQSLANQQSQNSTQASLSIGQQERANQMAERGMASQIQAKEREGDIYSRQQEQYRDETLLGMAQQRLGAAKAARQGATQSIMGGVGSLIGAAAPGLANIGGEGGFAGGYS